MTQKLLSCSSIVALALALFAIALPAHAETTTAPTKPAAKAKKAKAEAAPAPVAAPAQAPEPAKVEPPPPVGVPHTMGDIRIYLPEGFRVNVNLWPTTDPQLVGGFNTFIYAANGALVGKVTGVPMRDGGKFRSRDEMVSDLTDITAQLPSRSRGNNGPVEGFASEGVSGAWAEHEANGSYRYSPYPERTSRCFTNLNMSSAKTPYLYIGTLAAESLTDPDYLAVLAALKTATLVK